MTKQYGHWDECELYPRDDFEEESSNEDALTHDAEYLMEANSYHDATQRHERDNVLSVRVLRDIPREYGFGALIASRGHLGSIVEHTAAFFQDAFYARLRKRQQRQL